MSFGCTVVLAILLEARLGIYVFFCSRFVTPCEHKGISMCRIIVAIACLLCLSLRGEAQTATEVFQLRLASAELGQAILANNFIGTALTQDQVSHYIPRTNRCYVELTVQTGDVSKNLE